MLSALAGNGRNRDAAGGLIWQDKDCSKQSHQGVYSDRSVPCMSAFTSISHSVQDRFPTPSSWKGQGMRFNGQAHYYLIIQSTIS